MSRPRVAVIGGGLTGLATAWHLRDDAEVVLYEAAGEPGGQIRTVELEDGPLDVGADALLLRQAAGPGLLEALGFGDHELVTPQVSRVLLWLDRRLRELPSGTVFGVPTDLRALARSRVLTAPELAYVASERVRPRRTVVGDRSVSDLVGERFGRGVVQRLVDPLLGGVYAGDPARLSAQSTLPPVWEAAADHRSVTDGLRAQRRRTASEPGPVFTTVRDGLGRVIERLTAALGDRVRSNSRVRSLRARAGGVALHLDDRSELFDRVVLAVPPAAAADLLAADWRAVARELAGVRSASVGVVALAYSAGDASGIPAASGVLVPRTEGRLVKAITVGSVKWPHLASRSRVLLRASVGRIDDDRALALDDDELVERVDAEVRWALALRAPAQERIVTRWPDALPQYDVGHLARLDRIRHLLTQEPGGIHLGGAMFDGVGLSARAADAARLAADVRRELAVPSR
ncbi:MAG: protoporphyrinogen oxidase [Nitriliruptoraceae bacterium]